MATKTISITEDAYKLLASLRKRERESFSEVIIDNLGSKNKLKELYGILSNKAGDHLEENILEVRKKDQINTKKRIKEIEKELN
jgi:predicted CopG family antitoxin